MGLDPKPGVVRQNPHRAPVPISAMAPVMTCSPARFNKNQFMVAAARLGGDHAAQLRAEAA